MRTGEPLRAPETGAGGTPQRCETVAGDPSLVPVPGEVAAFVSAGRRALEVCARADEWDARGRRLVLAELDRAEALVVRMRATVVAAEQQAGTWALTGDRDLAGYVGRLSRAGRGAGYATVGQAATLTAMPAVADALVDGPVTPTHVGEIARATAASPVLAAQLATDAGQAEVVELARRLDGREFGRALTRLGASMDPASRQRSHDEQRAGRCLHLSHTAGGTFLKGRLDSVAGNLVQRALDALCPQPAAADDRDRGQRQADALAAMARAVLADPGTTPGSVVPAQVTLLVREETWAALRGARREEDGVARSLDRPHAPRRRPGRGSTREVMARLQAVAPVTDEDGNVLPASTVAATLCDCQVTRVVMDSRGVPIDEGYGERLFTARQRKAVIARDGGGCAFPGCGLPARYTQLHHVTWWSRGGRTDLDNAIQVCDHHHGVVHDRDIGIGRNRRGEHVFRFPDGRLVPGSAEPDGPPGAEPCPPPGGHRDDVPPARRDAGSPALGEQPLLWTA